MGFFDDFARTLNSAGRAISEAGAGVSHKTQDFAEIAKLGTQIQEQEGLKKAAFEELGRKYYETAADNEEAEGRDLIVKIRAIDGKIRVLKDKVCALKGTRECTSCHHLNPLEAVYCNQCGAKLTAASEDPEEEDIFADDVLEAEYVTVKAATVQPAAEQEAGKPADAEPAAEQEAGRPADAGTSAEQGGEKPVDRAAEAVGKTWENISEKTDEAVVRAADAAGAAAEKLEAGADAAVDKAAQAAADTAEKLEAGADAAVDKAAQATADAAEKLEAGADEAVDKAAHFAEETAKKAEETAADSVEKAAQFADEAVRKAMQYADEAAEKALQFAEKLRDEAKNRFGN